MRPNAASLLRAAAVIACLVSAAHAAAQQRDLAIHPAPDLPELVAYTTATYDLPDRVEAPTEMTVTLGGEEFTLNLWPISNRADDFRLLVQGADGEIREVLAPPPYTVRGDVRGVLDSRVRGELRDGKLRIEIRMPEANWEIQPLSDYVPTADAATHVVYLRNDVLPPSDQAYSCGVDSTQIPAYTAEQEEGGAAGTEFRGCEIGCDADVEFYVLNQSSVVNTMADIENIVNRMETIYERDVDVQFETTVIIVRTAESDPYSSTNAGTLLSQFTNEWTTNVSGGITAIRRDVAHLFTGKFIQNGVLGIAFLGSLCNFSQQYSLAESRFTTNFVMRTCVTAHEVGHVFNAVHCDAQPTCNIMCSGAGGCSNNCLSFEQYTINQILSFRNSHTGCLPIVPDSITPPFTDSFPSTLLETSKWTYNFNAIINGGAVAPPSGTLSLQLNATGPAFAQQDDLRTNFLLLAGLPAAVVSFYYEARGVESGEQLIVECWSPVTYPSGSSLGWVELGRITSTGVTQNTFTQATFNIPTASRWNEARIRFRSLVSDVSDTWYIDDVYVGAPLVTRTVNYTSDPTGVALTVSPNDTTGNGNGTTPFSRTYTNGAVVTVTAPAMSGGATFDTFLVNGAPVAGNPIMTAISANTVIHARYTPPVTHLVNFTSTPTGATISVSPADNNGEDGGVAPFLREYNEGTAITVFASPTHGGENFSHFLVNGSTSAGNPSFVTVNSDTTIEAVYESSTATLNISSTPLSGVGITVTPVDNGGAGDGLTPFSRTYAAGTSVTLTAPNRPSVGSALLAFRRWMIDAAPQTAGQLQIQVSAAGQNLSADYVRVGDMNGDGAVNTFDIDPFVLALSDPDGFDAQFPNVDRLLAGDINGDGAVNTFDIDPFVALLTGG